MFGPTSWSSRAGDAMSRAGDLAPSSVVPAEDRGVEEVDSPPLGEAGLLQRAIFLGWFFVLVNL